MTRILHLNDLHCFVVAYELGSFSRAADNLDTVQSQISTRIHRLECFAGVRLFARLPRGIQPSDEGEAFYQHAKRILSSISELESAVRLHRAASAFDGLG
jgi:DNA-binding transcriptional LysR family regulator